MALFFHHVMQYIVNVMTSAILGDCKTLLIATLAVKEAFKAIKHCFCKLPHTPH